MSFLRAFLILSCTALLWAPVTEASSLRYDVQLSSGQHMVLQGVNKKREENDIVVYLPQFGQSTLTNPQGVEVQATPVAKKPNTYKVTLLTSVWDCQKVNNLSACGNMAIPKNGVVLSASGRQRDMLFLNFQPGVEFQLRPLYRYESDFKLSAVNPTDANNLPGRGFPGARGPEQLVVYTRDYETDTTGTNEFGFEVTACGGRVVAREGANSTIRDSEDCVVLSGHGKARQWLLKEVPLGALVSIDGASAKVTATVDDQSYFAETRQLIGDIQAVGGRTIPNEMTQKLSQLELASLRTGKTGADDATLNGLMQLQNELIQQYWKTFQPVFSQPASSSMDHPAIRGVWHRPKENTTLAIRNTLARYKAAGLNTVFLETYLHGQPVFISETFKQFQIEQKLPFGMVDHQREPLTVWLEEAHQQGIKVHAWVQTFYAGNIASEKGPGAIITAHPSWANVQRISVNQDGPKPSTVEPGYYFLDPANPEVKTFLTSLLSELVTRYPIDGLQLDYIRYPSSLPKDKMATRNKKRRRGRVYKNT